VTSPSSQSYYQVGFDWGAAGAAALDSGCDAIVWVDQLGAAQQLPETRAAVVAGSIENSAAVAAWVIRMQEQRGDRFRIGVVAAGAPRDDGSLRFAVEDLLAAGAVIDALTAVGIDHCSPEAAAASAAYVGLRRAQKHLIAASVTARELGDVHLDLAPSTEVPVLRDFA
jgi:2-phosphosulfolactate phosphatase